MDTPKHEELVNSTPDDDYRLVMAHLQPPHSPDESLQATFPPRPDTSPRLTRPGRTYEPGPYDSFLDLSPPRSRFAIDFDFDLNVRKLVKDAVRSSYEWLRTTFHAPRINYRDELEWNCVRIPLSWARRRRHNDGGNQFVPPSTFDYSSYRGPYSPTAY